MRRLPWPGLWVLGALILLAGPPGPEEAMADQGAVPVVDADVRQAVAGGPARVLVELRLPLGMKPEGALPRPEVVAAQRGAIAQAQGDVLSRLARNHYSLLRRYETVPYLALEIDAGALTALERMGDVVARVLPDLAAAPAPRPGAR
jgi:hypothetical protein